MWEHDEICDEGSHKDKGRFILVHVSEEQCIHRNVGLLKKDCNFILSQESDVNRLTLSRVHPCSVKDEPRRGKKREGWLICAPCSADAQQYK